MLLLVFPFLGNNLHTIETYNFSYLPSFALKLYTLKHLHDTFVQLLDYEFPQISNRIIFLPNQKQLLELYPMKNMVLTLHH